MQNIFGFLKGYLKIYVYGISPERFLNMCARSQIYLNEIYKEQDHCYMYISLRDFYRIRDISHKARVKVVVQKRYGLPFLMKKIERNSVFFLGLCFCILFLLVMRNYIWAIDFHGNSKVTDDRLLDFLTQENITHGTRINNVDFEQLENQLRIEFPDIIWVSVGIEGTKLSVYVKERDVKQYDMQCWDTVASDLIATQNGVVASIITRSGVPKVKEGDFVTKGDILISGMLPIPAEDGTVKYYNPTNADADIFITYDCSYYDNVAKFIQVKQYTGVEYKALKARVFNKSFILPSFRKKPDNIEKTTDYYQVKLLDHFYLPMWLGIDICREYQMTSNNRSSQEMRATLEQNLFELIKSFEEKGVQIIQKDVKIYDGGFYMELSGRLTLSYQAVERVPIDPFLLKQENTERESVNE